MHFTLLSHHRLAGKGQCRKALEVQKGIAKTTVNGRTENMSLVSRSSKCTTNFLENKLCLLPPHAGMKVKLMLT